MGGIRNKMGRNRKIRRVVAKFGGKSLSDGERIHKAARAVAREVEKGVQIAVVVSALVKPMVRS